MLNRVNRLWTGWIVAVMLLIAVSPIFAQLPTGTILGTVRDQSGGSVAGTSVTILNKDTNQSRTVTTNEDGTYRVPGLPVGQYVVKFEKQGFETLTQQGLTLEVTQELVLNADLQVGTAAQSVTVTGEAQLVNTTSSSLGGLVNEQKIADLPLNGRNYIDLSLMQAGVTQHKNITQVAGTTGTYFSSNGATVRSNNYLLDGASMVNVYGASSGSVASTTLGVDGIKEYKVVTGTFSAEYGLTMGSQMVIVSKGGSNQFHGDVFEYHRDNALDAANVFDVPTLANGFRRLPFFVRNNFGAAAGGPIKKDKTFVFGVYEGLRERLGKTNIDTVPLAACHGPVGTVVWDGKGVQPPGSIGPCPTIPDPVKLNPVGSCPASTNSVVIGCVSPAVGVWADHASAGGLFPDPTPGFLGTTLNYTFPSTQPTQEDYGQIRVDHNFNETDSFFTRYTIDQTTQVRPRAYAAFQDPVYSRDQFLTLSENHIFSPNFLATARLSGSRITIVTDTVTAAAYQGPQYSLAAGRDIGSVGPGSGVTSFAPDPTNATAPIMNVFTGSYDLFYTHGRHSLKFGTLINYYQAQVGGHFSQKQTISFNNFADFLRGIPQTISGTDPNGDQQKLFLFDTFGNYLQDDFRATSRLTLNLGIRYEFATVPHEKAGKDVAFPSPTTDKTITLAPVFRNNSLTNFSPRVGFAWDVQGNGRTAVRGGFALMYDLVAFNSALNQETLASPPYSRLYTFSPPAPNPAATPPIPVTSFVLPFNIPANLYGFSARVADYNWKSPQVVEYTLAVERQLPFGVALSVGYVGTRGSHYPSLTDSNPAAPMTTPPGPNAFGYGVVTNGIGCDGNQTTRPNGTGCWGPKTPGCTNNVVPSCRINPNFANVQFAGTAQSKAWYNALQINMTKRLAHGLQFQTAFTWSQNLDTTQGLINGDSSAGSGFVSDPTHPLIDKGPAQFDVTRNLRFNLLYRLPNVGNDHFAAKALQGWWVGSILSMQTGYPFSPTLGANRSLSGVNGGGGGIDRADIVTPENLALAKVGDPNAVIFDHNTVNTGTVAQWFNPHMFTLGPVGFLGTASRNMLRGPGFENLDFSLNKDTPLKFLGEQGSLEFRTEVFNLFNHPNFGMPSSSVFAAATTTAAYSQLPTNGVGSISSTNGDSRHIQFALKVIF